MSSGVTARDTDLGNSERLVALHGADLRHVNAWGTWLAWDGKRWPADASDGALRAAIGTARTIYAEAAEELKAAIAAHVADPDDPGSLRAKKDAEKFFAHAKASQGQRRIEAMIALARADRKIACSHDQLDADPFLLNCLNGTLDLRTGKLRPHRHEDLITKLAPVTFDAKAKCPTWEAFVLRAMGGSVELVEYLQRVYGYALTGSISEHVVGFFFGGGANGKSTANGAMLAMLGDYAGPAPRGLLFRSRGDRHPTELASLHGLRFVMCAEIEEGTAFDEALVKDLSGGDLISARRMREDFWQFAPTHKIFLAGNHKPVVRGDDEGIWRRLRLVPWTVTIPEAERDKDLPEKLRAELPGVLAWCVRGCLAWQKNGLGDPPAVVNATAAYRRESDVLGEFFTGHVVFESEGRVARKVLRKLYEEWCAENGHEPLGARRFAGRLREQGVRDANVREGLSTVDGWAGVRPATSEERATRQWDGAVGTKGLVGHPTVLTAGCARAHEGNRQTSPHAPHVPTEDDERSAIEGFS